jgi:hypothetical protein
MVSGKVGSRSHGCMEYPMCPGKPAWVGREDLVAIPASDVIDLRLGEELIVY